MGVLNTGREDTTVTGLGTDYVNGSVQEWAGKIVEWYEEYGQESSCANRGFCPGSGSGRSRGNWKELDRIEG